MQTKASFHVLEAGEQPRIRSERVATFYAHWLNLAADDLPPRAAIDPVEMPALLPNLMLIALQDHAASFRVYYRLVGTAVAKFSGLDFTGSYLDALDFDICTTEDLLRAYREIRVARRPGLGVALARLEDDQIMDVEYLICPLRPLAANGPITQCIAIEDYMPSSNYDSARNKLGRKRG
jgi:hypothetical protein